MAARKGCYGNHLGDSLLLAQKACEIHACGLGSCVKGHVGGHEYGRHSGLTLECALGACSLHFMPHVLVSSAILYIVPIVPVVHLHCLLTLYISIAREQPQVCDVAIEILLSMLLSMPSWQRECQGQNTWTTAAKSCRLGTPLAISKALWHGISGDATACSCCSPADTASPPQLSSYQDAPALISHMPHGMP